jgi:hypothetical protein
MASSLLQSGPVRCGSQFDFRKTFALCRGGDALIAQAEMAPGAESSSSNGSLVSIVMLAIVAATFGAGCGAMSLSNLEARARYMGRRPAPRPVSRSQPNALPPSRIVKASWYGGHFQGRRTASGERFNQNRMTAASRTLPLGSTVRVTNLDNGRSVDVRINDRGPYVRGRGLDLSRAAARKIGLAHKGVGRVRVTPIRRRRDSAVASAL